jgi:hypothetical protein
MIIQQRTTILDTVLLKVVFPYLDSGNHRSLMRLARLWRGGVSGPLARESAQDIQAEADGRYARAWHHVQRAATRWLQPQHALAPIAIVDHNSRRSRSRSRTFEDEV